MPDDSLTPPPFPAMTREQTLQDARDWLTAYDNPRHWHYVIGQRTVQLVKHLFALLTPDPLPAREQIETLKRELNHEVYRGDKAREERNTAEAALTEAREQIAILKTQLAWDGDDPVFLAGRLELRESELSEARTRLQALEAALRETRADKDQAYTERNHVVAALARLFPSGVRATDIPGWDSAWHGCVYIDLPSGQISYHFHDSQAHLFSELPPYERPWDGHDKDTVHARLAALTQERATLLDDPVFLAGSLELRKAELAEARQQIQAAVDVYNNRAGFAIPDELTLPEKMAALIECLNDEKDDAAQWLREHDKEFKRANELDAECAALRSELAALTQERATLLARLGEPT